MADNSLFLEAKVGDIVHFSKFYVPNTGYTADVWAVAMEHDEYGHLMVDVFTGKHTRLIETDEGDRGIIVPEDEVPDWVWAALAKYRLTGDA